jgi:hypothetical protein
MGWQACPFESIDRHIPRRRPTMPPADSTTLPYRSVDAHGRAIPMTEAEILARAETIARGLDALDDMGDEGEQRATLNALIEGINAHPLSNRKRFR